MPPPSHSATRLAVRGPWQPGTIDWAGQAVVDPTPEPPFRTRMHAVADEQDACLRSAGRFYAQWGE